MATAKMGTLSGDLGDALSGSPTGAGTLYLTPPRWVAYKGGFALSPHPIAIPVAATGVITPTKIARTDAGQPADWAYRAYADVPGLSSEPFRLIMADDAMSLAEAMVPDEPGTPTWAPADLSDHPTHSEVMHAIRDQAGTAQQLQITGNTLTLTPGGNTVTIPTVTASGEPVRGPVGPAPTVTWDGTRMVVDGKPGPDLKGVPGPLPTITWDGARLIVDGQPGPDLQGPKGDRGSTGPAVNPSWTTYTPQLTNDGASVGDGTLTGRYCRLGELVHYEIKFKRGYKTAIGSTYLSLSLPTSPAAWDEVTGYGYLTTVDMPIVARGIGGGNIGLIGPNGRINGQNPSGQSGGDKIFIAGTYRVS